MHPPGFLLPGGTYLSEESKAIYESKDNKEDKVLDALDWLAAMGSDIPVKVGQTACQYGFSGNTR